MIHKYYTPNNFFVRNLSYLDWSREFDKLLQLFVESDIVKDTISKSKMTSAEQKACSLIFLKSQNLVIAVMKLCNEGIAEDAGIILRSLYENYIHVKYIVKYNLGKQFLNYRIAAIKKYTDAYENKFPSSELITSEYRQFKEKLNNTFDSVKALYINDNGEIRDRWHKKKPWQMAKELDESLGYDYIMGIYSSFVHCDVTGMVHYLIENEESLTFDNSPSSIKVDEILNLTYGIFGRIVTEWILTYNIEIPLLFQQFLKKEQNQ